MADSECISDPTALIPYRRRNKKSNIDADHESNLLTYLSEPLLVEILLRLPTTAAARFKVVCKRWYSLISSPYFIALFVHRRHRRDVQSTLVFQVRYTSDDSCFSCDCTLYDSDFCIISDSDCSLLYNVDGDRLFRLISPRNLHNVKLEGSFADLILCSYITHARETIYFVSNLLTRQWVSLPSPPIHEGILGNVLVGFLCVLPPCSECKPVHDSQHKFMVVRLYIPPSFAPCSQFTVDVFSSEERKWRSWVVSSPLALKCRAAMRSLVAYRGMLHWINADYIMVYDPLNTPQTFSRIIHLPIQLPLAYCIQQGGCLGECQGRLRVVSVSGEREGDPVVDVWELDDYNSGLWNLVHKQVYARNLSCDKRLPTEEKILQGELCCFSVVSLHPDNGDFVYLRISSAVVRVNMNTKTVDRYYPIQRDAIYGSVYAPGVANAGIITAAINTCMAAVHACLTVHYLFFLVILLLIQ